LEDAKKPTSNGAQVVTNEMEKPRFASSNNQYHPLLNYLLKNTPSKLKNNSMLLDP
jgi:hypothetical protein